LKLDTAALQKTGIWSSDAISTEIYVL